MIGTVVSAGSPDRDGRVRLVIEIDPSDTAEAEAQALIFARVVVEPEPDKGDE